MYHQDILAEEASRWRSARRQAVFTNRQFVGAVRAELEACGRPDIPFERSWFDEDTPGYRLLVHVPVGTEMTIPLRVMDCYFELDTQDQLERNANEFCRALINIKSAERSLLRYANEVRRAAGKVIAGARPKGLDVLLDKVGFTPTYVNHLSEGSWKEVADYVLTAITVSHTSFGLQRGTTTVWVGLPDEVAEALESILEDEAMLQQIARAMNARGADLLVDTIALDLLAAHGLDAAEILTEVWKRQRVAITVEHLGEQASLSLSSSEGKVSATLVHPDWIWNGDCFWFRGDKAAAVHGDLTGKSLGELVPHLAFTGRTIVAVARQNPNEIHFGLDANFLFDADTGRIWREGGPAA